MAAAIIKSVWKPPNATACPPINEPSDIPKKSALLFQANIAARLFGNWFASLSC
jgi:hypothetical protein